ncbi:hypothetical protein EYF80_039641 [Liparis tanakae]|uniref:Uncharacterized protein n=1 Tax=Liparis tanakae TaxID=230148 RepID=A0A4Z2GC03_9TELE|nr:hypothetical protein EYF80_039641 [Liparis tanakae]
MSIRRGHTHTSVDSRALTHLLTDDLVVETQIAGDQHADVGVTQVGAVDLLVPASRVDVCKGLVDLQGPDALIVHPVRGDAPLLPERPQADGAV